MAPPPDPENETDGETDFDGEEGPSHVREEFSEIEGMWLPAQGRQEVSREESNDKLKSNSEELSEHESEREDSEEGEQYRFEHEDDIEDEPENREETKSKEKELLEEEFGPENRAEADLPDLPELGELPIVLGDLGEEQEAGHGAIVGAEGGVRIPDVSQYRQDLLRIIDKLLVNPHLELLEKYEFCQDDYDTYVVPYLRYLLSDLEEREIAVENLDAKLLLILKPLHYELHHHSEDVNHRPSEFEIADLSSKLLNLMGRAFNYPENISNWVKEQLNYLTQHKIHIDIREYEAEVNGLLADVMNRPNLPAIAQTIWCSILRLLRNEHCLNQLTSMAINFRKVHMLFLRLLRILLRVMKDLTIFNAPEFSVITPVLNKFRMELTNSAEQLDFLALLDLMNQLMMSIERLPGIECQFAEIMEASDLMCRLYSSVTREGLGCNQQ